MLRAGWGSWRTCLLWGIATVIVLQSFALFMPETLVHPISGSSIANPVLAFEFARTPPISRRCSASPAILFAVRASAG